MVSKILSEKIKSWIIYGKSAFFEVTYEVKDEGGLLSLFDCGQSNGVFTQVVKKEKINGQWIEIC